MLLERRYAAGAPSCSPTSATGRDGRGAASSASSASASRRLPPLVPYQAGWYFSSRDRRAVDTHSRSRPAARRARWPVQEMTKLERALGGRRRGPLPGRGQGRRRRHGVHRRSGGRRAAARAGAARAGGRCVGLGQLQASLRALTSAGLVHGDLSAYNLLWWHGRLVLIDLPQAVEFVTNPHATELLHRDVENVAAWFERNGVAVDVEATFAELLALAW